MSRVVLGYSGSHYSSAAITWLATRYDEVVTVTVDVGQGSGLADVRERALSLGARRAHVVDARDELIRDFVLPVLRAGALAGVYPPAALSLPVIARHIVDIAHMEGSDAIALGASGSDDARRIESLVQALDSSLGIVRVPHDYSVQGGAIVRHCPAPLSVESNVWGRSIRAGSGARDDVPGELWALTRAVDECPDDAAHVEIEFENDVPLRINGIDMSLMDMIESLETIAGSHGVGRLRSSLEEWTGGPEYHEAPAAVVLHAAYRALHGPGDPLTASVEREMQRAYASVIRHGRWFSPAREAMDAFAAAAPPISGVVRLRLSRGTCTLVTVESAPAKRQDDLHPVQR